MINRFVKIQILLWLSFKNDFARGKNQKGRSS